MCGLKQCPQFKDDVPDRSGLEVVALQEKMFSVLESQLDYHTNVSTPRMGIQREGARNMGNSKKANDKARKEWCVVENRFYTDCQIVASVIGMSNRTEKAMSSME